MKFFGITTCGPVVCERVGITLHIYCMTVGLLTVQVVCVWACKSLRESSRRREEKRKYFGFKSLISYWLTLHLPFKNFLSSQKPAQIHTRSLYLFGIRTHSFSLEFAPLMEWLNPDVLYPLTSFKGKENQRTGTLRSVCGFMKEGRGEPRDRRRERRGLCVT